MALEDGLYSTAAPLGLFSSYNEQLEWMFYAVHHHVVVYSQVNSEETWRVVSHEDDDDESCWKKFYGFLIARKRKLLMIYIVCQKKIGLCRRLIIYSSPVAAFILHLVRNVLLTKPTRYYYVKMNTYSSLMGNHIRIPEAYHHAHFA